MKTARKHSLSNFVYHNRIKYFFIFIRIFFFLFVFFRTIEIELKKFERIVLDVLIFPIPTYGRRISSPTEAQTPHSPTHKVFGIYAI